MPDVVAPPSAGAIRKGLVGLQMANPRLFLLVCNAVISDRPKPTDTKGDLRDPRFGPMTAEDGTWLPGVLQHLTELISPDPDDEVVYIIKEAA
jgi:hypothetical protein